MQQEKVKFAKGTLFIDETSVHKAYQNLLATHLQHMYLFQHSYNFSIRTHNHSFLIASRKKPCQKHILLLTFKTLKN